MVLLRREVRKKKSCVENPVRTCRGRAGRQPRQLANGQVAGLPEALVPEVSVDPALGS